MDAMTEISSAKQREGLVCVKNYRLLQQSPLFVIEAGSHWGDVVLAVRGFHKRPGLILECEPMYEVPRRPRNAPLPRGAQPTPSIVRAEACASGASRSGS